MKTITKRDVVMPERRERSHKGQNGRLLIIAGSTDYPGAAALCGMAALRTGCDLVTIAAPEKAAWAINCLSPDLITKKLKGTILHTQHLRWLLEFPCDAALIGCGIGKAKSTQLLVKKFVKAFKKPLVIDADAITCISLADTSASIITPHLAEFEILLANTSALQSELMDKIRDNVIVITGKEDMIITRTETYKNTTGNEGMTVGGTGDVLAGLAAGFLAQGLSPTKAAINAAYIN